MKLGYLLVLGLVSFGLASALVAIDPVEYLQTNGYLCANEPPTMENVKKAILLFQRTMNIPETGILDDRTLSAMGYEEDILEVGGEGFYAVKKWSSNDISWKISKYSKKSGLTFAQQRDVMMMAMNLWAEVTPLKFTETTGKANITISFEMWEHGHEFPFDGDGNRHGVNILSYALPPPDGIIRFDDSENWVVGLSEGTNLPVIAAHEVGCALGVPLVDGVDSIMSAAYNLLPTSFALSEHDVKAVQELYGKHPTRVWVKPPMPTKPAIKPGFCNHHFENIDAVIRVNDREIIFFGSEVIDGRTGQRMHVQKLFPGGPGNVVAAVHSEEEKKTYLFEGKYVYVFDMDANGKFSIDKKFPRSYDETEAVQSPPVAGFSYMKFNKERRLVFYAHRHFDGIYEDFSQFYPFSYEDMFPSPALPPGPTIYFFENNPVDVDAAFSKGNQVYFIVGDKAYIMNISETSELDVFEKEPVPVMSVFSKCGP